MPPSKHWSPPKMFSKKTLHILYMYMYMFMYTVYMYSVGAYPYFSGSCSTDHWSVICP